MSRTLTLRSLRNMNLGKIYNNLVLGKKVEHKQQEQALKLGILLLNSTDPDVEKLGYRIILLYSNLYGNYAPLYDVCINKGYIPVAKLIERMSVHTSLFEEHFLTSFISSFSEVFEADGKYLTYQQLDLNETFTSDSATESMAVIAPTSYGKSELILESVGTEAGNVCIVVPTKALLAQTKRRLINSRHYDKQRSLITHPEMYREGESGIIAVLTQERLLRLLQKHSDISFNLIFIDEAHNLLEDTGRTRLLASVIIILNKRNLDARFQFLTPFLLKHSNLEVLHTNLTIGVYKVDEYLKSERLYCYDFRGSNQLELYDQFLDEFLETGEREFKDDVSLVLSKSKTKNIIYLNRPPSIEKFARKIANALPIISSPEIELACKALAGYVHRDYFLIYCLKRGVVYHHGAVTDVVKQYIERLYSTVPELRFIATTSTLLEGVNIPAERLFMLDYKKGLGNLSPSQFKNLVGRICRFKEVFNPDSGDINMLEPHVYLITSEFSAKNANVHNFLKSAMKIDRKETEEPENVLLAEARLTSDQLKTKKEAEEFLVNFEPGSIEKKEYRVAKTNFGRSCFQNSIYEFDILASEKSCQEVVDKMLERGDQIDSADAIIDAINRIFMPYIADNNLKRLENAETRSFYSMLFDWRVNNVSFPEMISSFIGYWKRREDIDPVVFVGSRWGDKVREDGHAKMWTDISKRTPIDRVNLAIVRIKEEQDYLDNTLVKFVEVFHDLELLVDDFYEQIRFGTSDKDKILLIKSGVSSALAGLLLKKYRTFVQINRDMDDVKIDPAAINAMRGNDENDITVFELECNVPTGER